MPPCVVHYCFRGFDVHPLPEQLFPGCDADLALLFVKGAIEGNRGGGLEWLSGNCERGRTSRDKVRANALSVHLPITVEQGEGAAFVIDDSAARKIRRSFTVEIQSNAAISSLDELELHEHYAVAGEG